MTVESLKSKQPIEGDKLDRARIAMISRGNRDAFEALYVDYHRRLSRFLLRFNADFAEVEEVINDTLFTVWKDAETFDGRSKVSTWIFGIAYRQACNMSRALARRQRKHNCAATLGQLNDSETTHATHTDQLLDKRMLDTGLNRLPLEQRLAVEMCYYLGYSCEEIGQITDCSANTVKSRLLAARKALRQALPGEVRS